MQCNRAKKKKGGNSNLKYCNAIAKNKKGGNSNLKDCNAIAKNKKGGNSNLKKIAMQSRKIKREVTPI